MGWALFCHWLKMVEEGDDARSADAGAAAGVGDGGGKQDRAGAGLALDFGTGDHPPGQDRAQPALIQRDQARGGIAQNGAAAARMARSISACRMPPLISARSAPPL